jgi:hypothetical protein
VAGIERLRQLMRQLRDELASMRAQVALTPTLLGDRERRAEDGSDDQESRTVAVYRRRFV